MCSLTVEDFRTYGRCVLLLVQGWDADAPICSYHFMFGHVQSRTIHETPNNIIYAESEANIKIMDRSNYDYQDNQNVVNHDRTV